MRLDIVKRYMKRLYRGVVPKNYLDLRHTAFDLAPLLEKWHSNRCSALISAPLHRVFASGPMVLHGIQSPYMRAAQRYIASGSTVQAIEELNRYYSAMEPKTAGDLLRVSGINGLLYSVPAIEGEFPWRDAIGPFVRRRRLCQSEKELNSFKGINEPSSSTNLFGPVPESRILFEAERIMQVADSIFDRGFRFAIDDPVIGRLMVRKSEEWCIDITGGKHRVGVLLALGFSFVPMLIPYGNVVLESKASSWPAVIENQIEVQEAEALFNEVFHVLNSWSLSCMPQSLLKQEGYSLLEQISCG